MKSLLDADYAAIEARIVCWLAGQEDALDEYRQGLDRYKVMASLIYGVPQEEVNKFPQRFVGKQATLGCGFSMGPAKFRATCKKMGGYDLPIGLEEKAVAAFRAKHAKVKQYWYDVERCAKRAILNRGTKIMLRNIAFLFDEIGGIPFLLIRLPSGRKLAYPHARISRVSSPDTGPSTTQDEDGTVHVHQGRKGRTDDRICFYGHVKGKTWGTVDTYGGKIVENCLAGHTQVLSESRGWVELHTVTTEDRVWDGVEFVDHGGLVNKGKQQVIRCHGVACTPDHLFLVEGVWISAKRACNLPEHQLSSVNETPFSPSTRTASQSCRGNLWESPCLEEGTRRWKENQVALQVHVREGSRENRIRYTEKNTPGVWFSLSSHQRGHRKQEHYPQHESASSICRSPQHVSSLPQSKAPSLGQLRWTWNWGMRKVVIFFRSLLVGYGAQLPLWFGYRSQRQRWGLHSTELSLGAEKKKLPKQTQYFETGRGTRRFLGRGSQSRNKAQALFITDWQQD